MSFNPRNILVIDFGQLGDVVLSLPALRAVRDRFPSAKITVAVGKPAGEIIKLSGYANETLEVDRVSLRDGSTLVSIGRIIKLVQKVRALKFDFVIDLHSLSETNILGFLSGASHRLYAHRPGRSIELLANFTPRPPREEKNRHQIDRYLDVLKSLGIENVSRLPFLKTSPTDDAAVDKLLKKERADSNSLLVGIFPGAGHVSRRWPIEKFAEVADFLTRNDKVRVIVFAGPEEREFLSQAKHLFPTSTIFFDKLTIPQLAAAQARLTFLISNDTGPMHIAAAVGTSVIAILDRPTPHIFVPVGDQHRLMLGANINEISASEVYQVAHELLASNRTEKIFNRADQR